VGRKAKKAIVKNKKAYVGVTVQEPLELTRKCRKIISDVLGNKNIGFTNPKRVAGNKVFCTLTGTGATLAEAKYRYQVIPFVEFESDKYWLAITLEFIFAEGLFRLIDISILVFRGEATDSKKLALLRAEWACSPTDIDGFAEGYEAQDFNPDVAEDNDFDVDWVGGGKFHFAMAARWRTEGRKSKNDDIEMDGLFNWLDGCISYIIHQIKYLHK
jgi:hypothetical protein